MSDLQQTLANIAALDRAALGERWCQAFGCPPPRSAHEPLLRRALSWWVQMQASAQWRRPAAMARLVKSLQPTAKAGHALTPGTRLLRQWKERTHEVTVLAQGFEYEGKTYRSLSAIARQITGTAWSGPAFFGTRE